MMMLSTKFFAATLTAVFTAAVYLPLCFSTETANCGHWTGEFLLVHDASASYEKAIKNLKDVIPPLFDGLAKTFPGSKFGIASFSDKPTWPMGISGKDYCYKTQVGLTRDPSALMGALYDIPTGDGSDAKESQYDALYHGLMSRTVKWSSSTHDANGNPILRVIILATDELPHEAGFAKKHNSTFIDHDGSPEPDCLTYDYPSDYLVQFAFASRKAQALFLISGDDKKPFWTKFLKRLEIQGSVQDLDKESEKLIDSIKKGLQEISCIVTPPPPPPTTTTTTTATTTTATTTTTTTATTTTTTIPSTAPSTTAPPPEHNPADPLLPPEDSEASTSTSTTSAADATTTAAVPPPIPLPGHHTNSGIVIGSAVAGVAALAAVGAGGATAYFRAFPADEPEKPLEFEFEEAGDWTADDRETTAKVEPTAFAW